MKSSKICWLVSVVLFACLAHAQIPCGPTDRPPLTRSINWPQYRFNTEHTGCNPYESILSTATVGGLVLDWTYQTYAPVYGDPVVANGVVYFDSISPDNTLYAVNARTGALVWSYAAGQNGLTAPVVVNGAVYVTSPDEKIYAFNAATGNLLWQYVTASVVEAAPVVVDGVLYAGDGAGHLYALNAATGTLLWIHRAGDLEIVSSPAVHNGVAYFAASDPEFPGSGTLYALNLTTRQVIWQYTWPYAVGGTPVVANAKVFFNSYALDANTGAILWNSPAYFFSEPVLANGVVYVGSDDSYVYALNANTGAIIWYFQTANFVSSSPAVANGVLYVESDDGNFYALNATTGALLWQYRVSTYGSSGPAVANGFVYIGSENSTLYAFHLPGH